MKMFVVQRTVGHARSEPVASVGIKGDQVMVWQENADEPIPCEEFDAYAEALLIGQWMSVAILAEARSVANTWIRERTDAQNLVFRLTDAECVCRNFSVGFPDKTCARCLSRELLGMEKP